MEKYANEVKLLNRFSNAKWVLSYYDDFPLCNVLMTSLCKDSKLGWDNNYNAFGNALEFTRKTFSYLVPFDSKVAEYLLEHSRFKIYSLSVIISTNKSIADLIDFINAVKVPSMLKFKKIEGQSNNIDIAAYNELGNLFNDKKWLDVNKIKASNTNFDTNNIDDFLEISHISYVKKSKNIKLFEQGHEYRVEHDAKHFIDNLSECYTYVHTLYFSLKSVPGSKSDTVLSATKQLQESVRCIKIDDVHESKLYKLDYLLPEFTEKLPKLNSIRFKSEICNFDLLISLVGRIKCNLLSKLSLDQIELGNRQQEEGTIVKFYPRIYLFSQSRQFAQVVRARKAVLQFGAKKAVHYSNKDILVFTNLTYLKLIDVTLDANGKQLMDCLDNHLSKRVKLIKPDRSYMALLNKDIDFMTIRFKKNPSFPNPNGKCLKIIIEYNKEASSLKNLIKMLSLIDNKTKVDAKFDFKDQIPLIFEQSYK